MLRIKFKTPLLDSPKPANISIANVKISIYELNINSVERVFNVTSLLFFCQVTLEPSDMKFDIDIIEDSAVNEFLYINMNIYPNTIYIHSQLLMKNVKLARPSERGQISALILMLVIFLDNHWLPFRDSESLPAKKALPYIILYLIYKQGIDTPSSASISHL